MCAWRLANKERIEDWREEYRQRNRERIAVVAKEYRRKNKEKIVAQKKEYRHKKGISKRYNKNEIATIPGLTVESRRRIRNQICKASRRGNSLLSIRTFQQIYEDNIKQYGTLTCYLCLKPIEFRQDCLEHKIPFSRGGTNVKDNINIAHISCNTRKKDMTLEEFRKSFPLEAGGFLPHPSIGQKKE